MKPEWSIRPYQEGDEEGIFRLWQAVHPLSSTGLDEWMKWWRWLYQENPAGHGLIWLGEADRQIVAQYCMVPVWLKVNTQIVLGAWEGDAMTHPDYRRQGLFESIGRRLYADAPGAGIDLSWGFPNQYSRPGLIKKMGCFEVWPASIALRPLNWENTINYKVRGNFLAGLLGAGAELLSDKIFFRGGHAHLDRDVTVREVKYFNERFDRLWQRISGQRPIMSVRNKDYLNWRFSTPGSEYLIFAAEGRDEVLGYLVLRERVLKNLKTNFILDMVAQSDEAMRLLLAEAIISCRQRCIDLITYGFIGGDNYRRCLKNSGFILLPFVKGDYLCVHPSEARLSRAFLKDPKNWLVQMADTDTF